MARIFDLFVQGHCSIDRSHGGLGIGLTVVHNLVVSNVLLALGLTQLSPTSVALPFKLLLLVAVDGWKLLARALALSYAS